ncbi:MAG: GAF domain-containing protein [Polyangiaceae bacterium]|nr:GAF domain-containing protein [Polyangiaceae bacterium]
MSLRRHSLDEILTAGLRGAAKLLGCSSATLILINDRTQEVRVRIGTMATSYPVLAAIETSFGQPFHGISLPVASARDSLVYEAWREGSIRETVSLSELVGTAFTPEVLARVGELIGERRFICVPAESGRRSYGVLLFEKLGTHSFSAAQREVLLAYARSVAEIIENDLVGVGQTVLAESRETEPDTFLFARDGRLLGRSAGSEAARIAESRELCAALAAQRPPEPAGEATERALPSLPAGWRVEARAFELAGEPAVLCRVERARPQGVSLGNELLRLTLRDPAPALFLGDDSRITSCNEATEQLFGYAGDELVGAPLDQLFRDAEAIRELVRAPALDPGRPAGEVGAVAVCRDGSLWPARVRALLFADDREQAVGALLLVRRDQRGADDAQPLLKERLAIMGEMAAQLAHEIRNPLLAIGASLGSLERDEADGDKRSLLAAVGREIGRLDMILRDCMAGRAELSVAAVRLGEAVAAARQLLAGTQLAAGKSMRVAVDPGLVVRADFDALKQVFFNLLHNALEASPSGGEVECRVELGPRELAVLVEDRGSGLSASPEECLRPFFTTKRNGTGLGLSVCQKIAAAHGGAVQLSARPGGGCTAALLLPRRVVCPA